MINLVIVDDHTLFRQGLEAILSGKDAFTLTGSYDSGEAFFEHLESVEPDVVLLDISLPDMSGFEVMKKTTELKKNIRFIIISMHNDAVYISKAMKLGAWAYLLKNSSEDVLLDTIKKVIEGKRCFDHISMEGALSMLALESTVKKPSQREQEILSLLAKVMTTKEMANQLFVSTRTIETHRNNLMKKLQVSNTAELIAKAVKLKMV